MVKLPVLASPLGEAPQNHHAAPGRALPFVSSTREFFLASGQDRPGGRAAPNRCDAMRSDSAHAGRSNAPARTRGIRWNFLKEREGTGVQFARERYDLISRSALLKGEGVRALPNLSQTGRFREQVLAMASYEVEETGRLNI
jgi:hypothetical protein